MKDLLLSILFLFFGLSASTQDLKLEYDSSQMNFGKTIELNLVLKDGNITLKTSTKKSKELPWKRFKIKTSNAKFKKGELTIQEYSGNPFVEIEMKIKDRKTKKQYSFLIFNTCRGAMTFNFSPKKPKKEDAQKRNFGEWICSRKGYESKGKNGYTGAPGENGPILDVFIEEIKWKENVFNKIRIQKGGQNFYFFQNQKGSRFSRIIAEGGTGGDGGDGSSKENNSKDDEYLNPPKFQGGDGGNGGRGGMGGTIKVHMNKDEFKSKCTIKFSVSGGLGGQGGNGGKGSDFNYHGRYGMPGVMGQKGVVLYIEK